MSAFEKMLNAITKTEKTEVIAVLILISIVVFTIGMAIEDARTDTSLVITNEEASLVIGDSNNLYSIASTTTVASNLKENLIGEEVTFLDNSSYGILRAQVVGECDLGVEIEFSVGTIQRFMCVKPSSYIIVGKFGDSYWDGNFVNGFHEKSWKTYKVVPVFFSSCCEADTGKIDFFEDVIGLPGQ